MEGEGGGGKEIREGNSFTVLSSSNNPFSYNPENTLPDTLALPKRSISTRIPLPFHTDLPPVIFFFFPPSFPACHSIHLRLNVYSNPVTLQRRPVPLHVSGGV